MKFVSKTRDSVLNMITFAGLASTCSLMNPVLVATTLAQVEGHATLSLKPVPSRSQNTGRMSTLPPRRSACGALAHHWLQWLRAARSRSAERRKRLQRLPRAHSPVRTLRTPLLWLVRVLLRRVVVAARTWPQWLVRRVASALTPLGRLCTLLIRLHARRRPVTFGITLLVSSNDGFCIKIKALCIKNEGFCI